KQKINSPSWTNAPIQFQGSSIYYNQHVPHYAYPYPVYRYPQPGYLRPQDIYEMEKRSGNLEFGCEVRKVWLRIVSTRDRTQVLPNDPS
ncbi:RNA-binding protein 24-B, partial [Trifolium medium]|nr:RNA-binding protein 24-B [Trifolium medium]